MSSTTPLFHNLCPQQSLAFYSETLLRFRHKDREPGVMFAMTSTKVREKLGFSATKSLSKLDQDKIVTQLPNVEEVLPGLDQVLHQAVVNPEWLLWLKLLVPWIVHALRSIC